MFDFLRFVEVGDYLAKIDDDAYLRSAIGRYYYGIFSSVRQYLIEIKHIYKLEGRNDIHKKVCDNLKNSNDLTENLIGLYLDELRFILNCADYDSFCRDYEFSKQNINSIKNESRYISQQIESLKKSPPFEL